MAGQVRRNRVGQGKRGGGVAVFYHDASHFQVGVYQTHGKNVAISQVAPCIQRKVIVVYVVPYKIVTTEDVVAAFRHRPCKTVDMMADRHEGTMTALESSRRGGR